MELQSGNLNFLNDIESLLKKSFCEKLRCIVFNIESAILNQNNQMLELSAIEIENFKITGKIFWIHIKQDILSQIILMIYTMKDIMLTASIGNIMFKIQKRNLKILLIL